MENADYAAPSPRPDPRPSLGKQAPRVHRLQRPRDMGTHRFLQGQLIRVKRGPKLRVKEDPPPSARPLTREREAPRPGRQSRDGSRGWPPSWPAATGSWSCCAFLPPWLP